MTEQNSETDLNINTDKNLDSGKMSSKQICITGMHRSGTSLVSMWLQSCGIKFAQDYLGNPRKFNKKGHFEDIRIVKLHESVINKLFPNSKGWIVTKDIECAFDAEQNEIARKIIMSYQKSYNIWGFKDPRMCLFLQSWKDLLPDLKIVFVWRSADSVLRSMIRRARGGSSKVTKINIFEAIQSWKVYNKKILEFCNLYPDDTILIPLSALLAQDKNIINSINSKFDVRLQYIPIRNVYESELLTARDSGYSNLFPGITRITRELANKSFVCHSDQS